MRVSPFTWNGPICPGCGKPYLGYTTWTTTVPPTPYVPKHRKPGPAQ